MISRSVVLALLAAEVLPQTPADYRRVQETLRTAEAKEIDTPFWPTWLAPGRLVTPEAEAVLERAASHPDELAMKSPLEKALFQRTLWAFFDSMSATRKAEVKAGRKPPNGNELMARVLRNALLTEEEIRGLGDSYDRTVASKTYPEEFDPEHPERPFLPPNPGKADGPWVFLGSSNEVPLGIRHLKFFGGRFAFLIYLRAPGDRTASLQLAKTIRDYVPRAQTQPPPKLLEGTQVMLLWQDFFITSRGKMATSPLVDAVELRVFRKPGQAWLQAPDAQSPYLFRLRPDLLLAGDPAPLRFVPPDSMEPTFMTLEYGRPSPPSAKQSPYTFCAQCHGLDGTLALRLVFDNGSANPKGEPRPVPDLVDPEAECQRTIRWKEKSESWKEFEAFWR